MHLASLQVSMATTFMPGLFHSRSELESAWSAPVQSEVLAESSQDKKGLHCWLKGLQWELNFRVACKHTERVSARWPWQLGDPGSLTWVLFPSLLGL